MLDKIMGNKGMVKEIRRGGEKVWEMPRIKLNVDGVFYGSPTIEIKFYPYKSTIKVYVNKKQVNTAEQNPFGSLNVGIRDNLKYGDKVEVIATCPGWAESKDRQTVF